MRVFAQVAASIYFVPLWICYPHPYFQQLHSHLCKLTSRAIYFDLILLSIVAKSCTCYFFRRIQMVYIYVNVFLRACVFQMTLTLVMVLQIIRVLKYKISFSSEFWSLVGYYGPPPDRAPTNAVNVQPPVANSVPSAPSGNLSELFVFMNFLNTRIASYVDSNSLVFVTVHGVPMVPSRPDMSAVNWRPK